MRSRLKASSSPSRRDAPHEPPGACHDRLELDICARLEPRGRLGFALYPGWEIMSVAAALSLTIMDCGPSTPRFFLRQRIDKWLVSTSPPWRLPCSLMVRRRSFIESALRSASS